MLQPYRDQFNAQFTSAKYADLIARLSRLTRTPIEFRIAETPCFFPQSLLDELTRTGAELTHQLLDNPAYMQASNQTSPPQYLVPNENPRPNFMTVDFGLVRSSDGTLSPKLVELQATAEGAPYSRSELDAMLALAHKGVKELIVAQKRAIATLG